MTPVLVIGGGPAGAGAAIALARQGRRVQLIERESGPHDKVCGEFLSYEAIASLRRLGVDPAALGAEPILDAAVYAGATGAQIRLPFTALSLSRRRLDEALLQQAIAQGVDVCRGIRIRRLEREGADWVAEGTTGERFVARDVMLATGKHDLRGWKRPPGRQHDLIGFKQHLKAPTAALRRRVELHLFGGGYAGIERVEGGLVNLCLVVRKAVFTQHGLDYRRLLSWLAAASPRLGGLLRSAMPVEERPLAIFAIPYGHVQQRADGVWRLGDQAAVIPSFAGEGMAIALHSAEVAAEHFCAGLTAGDYQKRLARDLRWQVAGATLLSRALVEQPCQWALARLLPAAPSLIRVAAVRTRLGMGVDLAAGSVELA